MSNPENNWVHISLKASNGTIFDARAEEGDTLRALVDGALGAGAYEIAAGSLDPAAGAVETVKSSFGNTTTVKQGGFGDKGRQAQQSEPDEVELGEHDGYKIYAKKSKFGGIYYSAFKAGADRINSKSIKGATVGQATLAEAIDKISEAA